MLNPILTGLFETKFLLGGGGGGQFDPPLQISAPKGPIAAKFCMDVKTHVKSIALKKIAENSLFIVLLWFMQIRCIISHIYYYFQQIRYLKANFWQKVS